ncbi:MAG TPA: hypothetical protein VHC86_12180 [Opitutaceae bacterium]|nr:hypothetical protein [Opitutaceae bacterium]
MLQFGLPGNERVLEFLELVDFELTLREGRIEAAYSCLELFQLGSVSVNRSLLGAQCLLLPTFDPGQEALLPNGRDRYEPSVALNFRGHFSLWYPNSVLALQVLPLAGAAVIDEGLADPASLEVPLASDREPTFAASSEAAKLEALVLPVVPRLCNFRSGDLDSIPHSFRNHREMRSLMHFPLHLKDTVVEWIL